ncbi:DegT/DnrJ/EryC1/StrS family aminotransferase [Acetomicrobium sp.]|uniref:DegT/DnrJ/EryC1/StrS family aminotransferase n=1 Tax=Acetomicrobium sp. TaxID=1872099 RepID=UPI002870EA27|nr:DegT/DnrJ/EryC1/StrS family aminotransferase [Acetomicrobium sp.]MDR9770452.1 DegT/DnrJ/EryC1/StrS family aminotransferase [Acetomicrobium sp.]
MPSRNTPIQRRSYSTHLYGLSADLDPIMRMCRDYNVTLIEDAAESLGTKYKGKYTGTFGKYGVFSL